jgi:hypothetical protein
VNLTPLGKFVRLGWAPIGEDRFRLLSSVCTNPDRQELDKYARLGEKLKVNWLLNGRSALGGSGTPIWQLLLMQAREQLDRAQHNLSIFCSATALEAFVDEMIVDMLNEAGVAKGVAEVVVGNSSGMRAKGLIFSKLTKVQLDDADVFRKWYKKVGNRRNQIAHGEKDGSSEKETRTALELTLRVVFYILQLHPGRCSLFPEYSLRDTSEA